MDRLLGYLLGLLRTRVASPLLLGIVLQATMSFFIFVPVQDSSQSTALGVLGTLGDIDFDLHARRLQ